MTEIIQDSLNQKYELATRGSRFFAYIVDTIISAIIVYFVVLRWYPLEEIALDMPDKEIMFSKPVLLNDLYRTITYIVIYFIVNYAFLRNGQTIGKWLLNIQVADVQGKVASIWMVTLREK